MHPLIGDNPQYINGDKNNIYDMEKALSVSDMIGFCKGSIYKYSNRSKGEDEQDEEKKRKYHAYLYELEKIPNRFRSLSVRRAFKKTNVNFNYKG